MTQYVNDLQRKPLRFVESLILGGLERSTDQQKTSTISKRTVLQTTRTRLMLSNYVIEFLQ